MQSDQQQNGDPDPQIESNVAQTNLDLGSYKQPSQPEVAHSSTQAVRATSITSGDYTTYEPSHIERNSARN